jgi:hypothetical protein
MLSYPVLRQGLSVMRANLFAEIGGYRFLLTESTEASSDTEFYFRLGCHYRIYCLDEVLYYYRIHEKSISTKNQNEGLQQKKIYEVKMAIINYYYLQHKINKKFWRENNNEIKFNYCLFKNYKARRDRKILLAIRFTLELIFFHPDRTWHHFNNRWHKVNN